MPLKAINSAPMRHMLSGIDDDAENGNCGSATVICGYTEWISASEPTVTLGWDWALEYEAGKTQWKRIGLPRTNVMLVDEAFRDYGWDASLTLLADVVDRLGWCDQTERAVSARYSS